MKYLMLLLVAITTFSCTQEDENKYKIIGDASGLEDGTKIMIYSIERGMTEPVLLDSAFVNNGKFEAKLLKKESPVINYLSIKSLNANVVYFPGTEDLKATIYKDSVQASFVEGGEDNALYASYIKKMKEFGKKRAENMKRFREARQALDNGLASNIQKENRALATEEKNYKKEIVKNNPNSIFSAMLLSELISQKTVTPTEANEIIANFSPKIAASPMVKDIKELVSSMSKAEVGQKAPDFSAPTPDGKMLSLKEAMGKYTIIDFWASWCKPCRMENPNVVKVYNKYHDKGLNIISVSLDKDGQKDRWIKAIEDDKLTWNHISNLKFWNEPIAKMYNVRSIPATFLLDENGVIIAKNLRGKALENKIASLLGE